MLALHYVLNTDLALVNLYPRFWSIQSLLNDAQIGTYDENNQMKFPPRLNLSSEKLDRGTVFILENGLEIFIWIGRAVAPELLSAVFGQPSIDLVTCGKTSLPVVDTDLNKRLRAMITSIRETRLRQATLHPPTYIVREDGDPQLRMWFLSHLIEDRIDNQLSYPQFLGVTREKVQKQK
jgi:protein transport protein SEC24